ncbi:MAG: YncE family protein, partial [Candidatus Dormibacteraceae bacterium]
SNTVTEINLATNSVIATLAVGTAPDALAPDPSGNYFWVAGLNYISKVSYTTFSIVSTTPISGQVTALAISNAQNEWVYTTISTDLATFSTQDAVITTGSPAIHSEAQISTAGTYYILGGGGASAPPPYLKASTVVSSNYNNGIAVTSSPTGFVVLDLVAHKQLMEGTTPTPVRGIATDPTQGVAYLTAPESNSIISVPLPAVQSAQ